MAEGPINSLAWSRVVGRQPINQPYLWLGVGLLLLLVDG
jgi:hypothetical protein